MNSPLRTILALDSACGPCSVALLVSGELRAYRREEQTSKQAAMLVPMMEEVMKEAGLKYAALDAIVSTVGPGSFTGLRISLSAALGLGLATCKPVYGITTLTAVAYAARENSGELCAVLNAGKGEVYAQTFAAKPFAETSAARIVSPDALPPAPYYAKDLPDARNVALLAFHHPELLLAPEPLYIRPPDAKPMSGVL